MSNHQVVSSSEWLTARKQLLAKEKEFSRLRDEITQLRRDLPWQQMDKQYVFRTYSCYGRGLENLLGIYNFLDLVPKGRDEAALPYSMAWVRHHDKYDDGSFVDPYIEKS